MTAATGVLGLAADVRARRVSAEEVLCACLDRIRARDGEIGAFIRLDAEPALARAREVDRRVAAGDDPGPLAGVPVALKDNLCTLDGATTCASRILGAGGPVEAAWRAPYEATAIRRLVEAGAVPVGKTNMDEFAMGSSTEHSAVRPTRNPVDPARVPGGSSGGSAAAVAAGYCAAALGSDTGGSIRQPAALCGVVGLKPTYGRVSRYGLVAFASSLDQIGPFGRSVRDAAAVYDAIAGHDPLDSTSAPLPPGRTLEACDRGAAGLRIGLPREYLAEGLDPEVRAAVEAAVRRLEGAGARVEEVSLPHTKHAVAVYYLVATAEASSNLARFDAVRYGLRVAGATPAEMTSRTRGAGFGPEVKRRIMLGTYALSAGYYDAYYKKALQVRTIMRRDLEAAFERVDVLATPTVPEGAFPFGAKTADPLTMYLSDVYTISANLAGIPAVSVPCGRTKAGLPIGLQFMAKPYGEETLLAAAAAHEALAGGAA